MMEKTNNGYLVTNMDISNLKEQDNEIKYPKQIDVSTSVKTNSEKSKISEDKKMAPIPIWKSIPATILVIALIWKPLLVVLTPGWVYTDDLTTVFLFEGCIGGSTQTVFVFCLLEVLTACVLLQRIVVPALFGAVAWSSFGHLKRRKLVGYCVKVIVRVSCFIQIAFLVAPYLNYEMGLFGQFNIKDSNIELRQNRTAMTCDEAGMNITDAVAMRAWIFSRDDIMAVMVWELAAIPELGIDAWVHHLFVILGVVIGTDPSVMAQQADVQPLIDNVAFFLVLGGSVAGLVESCVLAYHLSAKNPKLQSYWMILSIIIQSVIVLTLFVAFPAVVLVSQFDNFGGLAWGYFALIGLLVAVEGRMVWVKLAIVKHCRNKAAKLRRSNSIATNPNDQSTDAREEEIWDTTK